MPIVTLDGGQSSVALGGQTMDYVAQLVAQQLQGAPDTLIQSQLQLVAREFYTKSTGWRDTVGPYNVLTNREVIDLNPVDQNTRVQFVLGAYFLLAGNQAPQPLVPLTRKPVGGNPNTPLSYFMQKPDVLQLFPVPNAALGKVLYVYACLVPTPNANLLPDISYTHHIDALLWGTLARLYMMPKKAWSNQTLAMQYQKQFRQEILIARDIATRGYGPADNPVRFPPFAGRAGSQILPRATGG